MVNVSVSFTIKILQYFPLSFHNSRRAMRQYRDFKRTCKTILRPKNTFTKYERPMPITHTKKRGYVIFDIERNRL